MTSAADVVLLPLPTLGSSESGYDTDPLWSLATAIVTSRPWARLGEVTLVVGDRPRPLLAVAGFLRPGGKALLSLLAWQLEHVAPTLRFVDYAQAERDCEQLAGALRGTCGPGLLGEASFLPIPRGGAIVLGMLAYALQLRPEQFRLGEEPGRPVVVVDDCAVSGLRFGQLLPTLSSNHIVFATLYAHPDLRAAVVARERRVRACVSARDLVDHAPERLGGEYEAWLERWRARGAGYWIGQPDHVAFAWGEPEITYWDDDAGRSEASWRLLPPERCLKHRGEQPPPGSLQRHVTGVGALRTPEEVIHATLGDRVVVADLRSGVTVVLEGVAAAMWQTLLQAVDEEQVALTLAQRFSVEAATVRADLAGFSSRLCDEGMLVERGFDS